MSVNTILCLQSEDRSVLSEISWEFGFPFQNNGIWLPFRLTLTSGKRREILADLDNAGLALPEVNEATTNPPDTKRCVLGLSPRDELEILDNLLQELLANRRQRICFEPQEPNWTLAVEQVPEGYLVICWIDAGNQWSGHYTWDGLGIRFFTLQRHLVDFAKALAQKRLILVPPKCVDNDKQ
ncbi:MAG: hypothetical protein HY692_04540 [Cyanobacteria bacterium NC_groundwater_1444_Ag_S-0.65um_54_12]|nr:hypothetical protein [Cyanobacteria bacterium NC_groundwater_1444_Ag_S-0.65um_54_12]